MSKRLSMAVDGFEQCQYVTVTVVTWNTWHKVPVSWSRCALREERPASWCVFLARWEHFLSVACVFQGIDVKSMGRIFVGLVKCGAWGCFDEFNRLEEAVLSAVSMQIQAIQDSLKHQKQTCELLGKEVNKQEQMQDKQIRFSQHRCQKLIETCSVPTHPFYNRLRQIL